MNLVASVIFFCAGIGVFLFIQSVLPYTYLFSVFSLSLNNHEVIQKINAENSIKSGNNINESNSIKRSSRDNRYTSQKWLSGVLLCNEQL